MENSLVSVFLILLHIRANVGTDQPLLMRTQEQWNTVDLQRQEACYSGPRAPLQKGGSWCPAIKDGWDTRVTLPRLQYHSTSLSQLL